MKRNGITVHGFRSSFRDWPAERTNYPREMCELMKDWTKYCETPQRSGKVTPVRKKA